MKELTPFTMEEVTLDRLRTLDVHLSIQAHLTGRPSPRDDLIHTYACPEFHTTYAEALNVGFARDAVPCIRPGCGAVATMSEAATCRKAAYLATSPSGRIDFELYRPLTQEDLDAWRLSCIMDAVALVADMGGDITNPTDSTRLAVVDGYATRLLNGNLALRDMEGTPMDDRAYARDAVPA